MLGSEKVLYSCIMYCDWRESKLPWLERVLLFLVEVWLMWVSWAVKYLDLPWWTAVESIWDVRKYINNFHTTNVTLYHSGYFPEKKNTQNPENYHWPCGYSSKLFSICFFSSLVHFSLCVLLNLAVYYILSLNIVVTQ